MHDAVSDNINLSRGRDRTRLAIPQSAQQMLNGFLPRRDSYLALLYNAAGIFDFNFRNLVTPLNLAFP